MTSLLDRLRTVEAEAVMRSNELGSRIAQYEWLIGEVRAELSSTIAVLTNVRSAITALENAPKTQNALESAFDSYSASMPRNALSSAIIEHDVRLGLSAGEDSRLKDKVLSVLSYFPSGLETQELANAIQDHYGDSVARTTLSPLLSRLKQEGSLVLDGRRWLLQSYSNTLNALASSARRSRD